MSKLVKNSISSTKLFDLLYLNENQLQIILWVGGVVVCTKIGWDIARKLSMSGKSKNFFIKFFHNLLKPYLNCGIWIRREFFVLLPSNPFFLKKRSYTIVNYGSYGTVPVKVLQYQFNVQKQLEYCPDLFNRITLHKSYEESRLAVAKAVNCEPNSLVFVENVTEAVTCSLRSLLRYLNKDDAILCLRSLAYGAVAKAIDVLAKEYDVKVIDLDLHFPIISKNDICILFEETFLKYPNVKLAVFDHITSASSLVLPIQDLGVICRKYNVISIVDGAHAPGQLYLNIDAYNIDVYLGNLHKWYYTPKSCAIMCVNKKLHDKMQPSWISHLTYGSFQERFFMQGTKNYSPMLTAGYAVNEFMESIGGLDHLHSYIPPLIEWAVQLYISEWGTEEVQIPVDMKAPYMRTVYLPDIFTEVYGNTLSAPENLIKEFLEEENLAIVFIMVQHRMATRVSAQIFSTRSEYIFVAKLIKKRAEELRLTCL